MGFIVFLVVCFLLFMLVRAPSSQTAKPKVSLDVIEAADRGDTVAQRKLDEAFDKGLTSEEHNALRFQRYAPKANAGDPFAQYWLGFHYAMVSRNAELAEHWYEESAKQGNIEAMRALAFGYGEYLNSLDNTYGHVPFGRNEGAEWYWLQKAAERGDAEAIDSLNRLVALREMEKRKKNTSHK